MEKLDNLLSEIENLNTQKKYTDILKILKPRILKKYNNDELYTHKASAAYSLKKDLITKKSSEAALKINSNNIKARNLLANTYSINEEYSKALDLYFQNLSYIKTEKMVDSEKSTALCNIGYVYHKLKDIEKAIKFYRKSLKCNPKHVCALNGFANLYFDLNLLELANEYYKRALKINSKSSEALCGIASILLKSGEKANAKELLKKSIRFDPYNQVAHLRLGLILITDGNFRIGISHLKKVLKITPSLSEAYYGIGFALKKQNKNIQAIEFIKNAIRKDKTQLKYYYQKGEIECKLGNYEVAIDDFKTCLSYSKSNENHLFIESNKRINELEYLLQNKTCKNLERIVKSILEVLEFDGSQVTHYTSVETLKKIIINQSPFRLSEAAFMNDSSEGAILFNSLGIYDENKNYKPKQFYKKPFIGSFVSASKADDLNLWRLYGKDEKNEANGCSVTFNVAKLKASFTESKKIANKRKLSTNNLKTSQLIFYRVGYLNPITKNVSVPELPESDLKELNDFVTFPFFELGINVHYSFN